MEANGIMSEECADYLRGITMTYGLPPREGAFIKFASLSAIALIEDRRAATQDELKKYFVSLGWHDTMAAGRYADYYGWLVRAFLFMHGRNDIDMFTFEKPV